MAQVLKEEMREKILSASTKEFFERGFDDSSLRSIAKVAGTTPGNIYRYFDNKDVLYETVVGDSYRKLNNILKTNSNNKLGVNIVPTEKLISEIRKNDVGLIASKVIQETLEVFSDNKMGLLILLKDDRADFVMNTRFGLMNWFKSQFEVIYGNPLLAEDLAYSFTEGLIKLLMKDNAGLEERVEAYVQFYYMRGIQKLIDERNEDE